MKTTKVPAITSVTVERPSAAEFTVEVAVTERKGGPRLPFKNYCYLPDGTEPTFTTVAAAEAAIRDFVKRWEGWHSVDVRISGR